MFTAKGGCCNPLDFWLPDQIFCEIIHGYVFGIKESNGDSWNFLYRMTLKLKVIAECWLPLFMAVEPLHDLHYQGHGVAPQDLFIDFRTPWPKKHRYRHQDYLSSMFLAKDTKIDEHSAL